MLHVFFFLLGFGLTVMGCTYWIIYLNYLTIGYTWFEYFSFVLRRPECLFAILGFFIMTLSILWKGEHNLDLYL